MNWNDLTPAQRDALIRGLKHMLGMFKDWYRTGLMGKITTEALTRADGVFADILIDPAVVVPPPTEPPAPVPPPLIYGQWFDSPPDAAPYRDGDVLWGVAGARFQWIVLGPEAVTAGPGGEKYYVRTAGAWVKVVSDKPLPVPPPAPTTPPLPPVPPVEPPVEPPPPPVPAPTEPPPAGLLPWRKSLSTNPLLENPWGFPVGARVFEGLDKGETVWAVVPADEGIVWPGSTEVGIIGVIPYTPPAHAKVKSHKKK